MSSKKDREIAELKKRINLLEKQVNQVIDKGDNSLSSIKPVPKPRKASTLNKNRPVPKPRSQVSLVKTKPVPKPRDLSKIKFKINAYDEDNKKIAQRFKGLVEGDNQLLNSITGKNVSSKKLFKKDGNLRKQYSDYEIFNGMLIPKAVKATAHQGRFTNLVISNTSNYKGMRSFQISNAIPHLFERYKDNKRKHQLYKAHMSGQLQFKKDGQESIFNFTTKAFNFSNDKDLKNAVRIFTTDIKQNQIPAIEMKGSGWKFDRLLKMDYRYAKSSNRKGSSYRPLPAYLLKKKAIINVKNNDDHCLKYSIACGILEPEKNAERVSKYKTLLEENDHWFKGVNFPAEVTKKTFQKIESNMKYEYGLNVYVYEDKIVSPSIITENREADKVLNLLYLPPTNKSKGHYCFIKNRSRLLGGDETKHDGASLFCDYCTSRFTCKSALDKHVSFCQSGGVQKVVLPEKGTKLKFRNPNRKVKAPFMIYSDFECVLQGDKHIPSGFGLLGVSSYDDIKFEPVVYRGTDCMSRFFSELNKLQDNMIKHLQKNKKMIITDEQEIMFKKTKYCWLCDKALKKDRVRDHDHMSGLYRGAAHNECNLECNFKGYKIPVVFHNMKNYDGHLIISRVGKHHPNSSISVIAQNSEKYVTFSFNRLKFIDSFGFLSTSLEKLANNLDKDKFKYLDMHMRKSELFKRKGVYPYEYINSFTKFNETKLPPIEKFYSSLTKSTIKQEDYDYAQKVWKELKVKNLGEWHDIYMKSDIMILADVFEEFRRISFDDYGLDPGYYLTLPGFAWDCMLFKTKISFDLISDIDMYTMLERGLRGGMCSVFKRFSIANNKYMKDFDPKKASKYIMYWDANNLYGGAMCESLPHKDFEFVDPKKFRIDSMFDNDNKGYILDVDIEYPEEIHDEQNEYPMAPESLCIKESMTSTKYRSMNKLMDLKHNDDVKKLVPNLMNKKNYVVHYRNLAYYMEKGLKVTSVNKVIRFSQSKWLKTYIDHNSENRKNAKNDFEKDFYKLMNNAVYGKTMENIRNRIDYRLTTKEQSKRLIANPRSSRWNEISEELVGICMTKQQILLNKPIYVGVAVTELSKLHMYKFHYDYIKKTYGDKAKLLYTDTDSLTYEIETDDVYEDTMKNKYEFDLSNYPKDSKFYDETNKKVVYKMKDETAGKPIKEFVGLRSKMYSMLLEDEEKKTAKGVKSNVIKNEITYSDYKRCLFYESKADIRQSCNFNIIKSKDHVIKTVNVDKVSLSCADDKRYLEDDNINTIAYGHYKLKSK